MAINTIFNNFLFNDFNIFLPKNENRFPSIDVPSREADALIKFYEATDGDNWTTNTGWGVDTTVGNWFGVTVSGGHVTDIILNDNDLNGEGLQCLSPLSELTSLYLQDNGDMTGDVGSLNNLSNLEKIYCHDTGLYGNFNNYSAAAIDRIILFDTDISGDLNQFAVFTGLVGTNLWEGLSVYKTNIDSYTSTTLPAWGCFISVRALGLSATHVNNFIQDLDTAGGTGGTLNISGTNAAPSWGTEGSPSDTALAVVSLLEKDWTLTVTGDVPDWVLDMVEWTIESGTLHMATKDGEAMFFHDTEDFSDYAAEEDGTSNYLLEFVDNAGKTARAYAGDVGGGEVLGDELVTNGDMEIGDPPDNWNISPDCLFERSAVDPYEGSYCGRLRATSTSGRYIAQDINITTGSLYFYSVHSKASAGEYGFIALRDSSTHYRHINSFISSNTWYNTTKAFTPLQTEIYNWLYSSTVDGDGYYIDAVSLKKYTDIPTTGLHLVSTQDGSTRNMASAETGFNPNEVVKVRFLDPNI